MSTNPQSWPSLLNIESGSAYISNNYEERFYLTGFRGTEGWVVVTETIFLLVDPRYHAEAQQQSFPTVEVVAIRGKFSETLDTITKKNKIANLIYNPHNMIVATLDLLKEKLKGREFIKAGVTVESVRTIKTPDEIKKLRKAQAITDQAFISILENIKAGVSEKQLAWETEKYMREAGADTAWKPFVVASGINSSRPHHVPDDTKIKKRDLVRLDIGSKFDEYCSDMARVIFIGTPSDYQARIYNEVKKAQDMVISLIKPDVKVADLDLKARSYLESTGLKEVYPHALGHGVGLNVHERPVLSTYSNEALVPNMVITVEPGVYDHGKCGVLLEDLILVTKTGAYNLTKAPKEIRLVTKDA